MKAKPILWPLLILILAWFGILTSAEPIIDEETCRSSWSPTVTTDKPDYEPGETVVMSGEGFECGAFLIIEVVRPDGSIILGDGSGKSGSDRVRTDASGNFIYEYQLNGVAGTYTVNVRDATGAVLATTTFTDTHFRFGHLTWGARPDIGANTVEFRLLNAFRRSGYGGPGAPVISPTGICNTCPPGQLAGVGDIITETIGGTNLVFGDGNSTAVLQYQVIAANDAQDFLVGEALNPSTSNPGIIRTYAGSGPFTARIDDCCRITDARHINNSGAGYRVETIVNLSGGATGSPVSLLPPIVDCPQNALCQFQIISADPDVPSANVQPPSEVNGDGVGDEDGTCEIGERCFPFNFRLSTLGESQLNNQPGPPSAPNAANISTGNCFGFHCGTYAWNTTGADLNPAGETLYSTQVTIEELNSAGNLLDKSAIDFFVRLVPPTPVPAGNIIKIPVRMCGVQGSPSMANPALVGEVSTDNVLLQRLARMSNNIYLPQVGIMLRSGATAALPNFPVISDPDPINTPAGNIRDYNSSRGGDGGDELIRAINRCRAAWQSAPEVTGLVALHLNEYVDGANTQTGLLGVAMIPQLSNTASQMLFGYGTTIDNRYTLQGEILGDGVGNDDRRCDPGEACQGALETIGDTFEIVGDGIGNDDGFCQAGEAAIAGACTQVGDDDGTCEPGEACRREVIGDGIGDDDGLCEAGETCQSLSGDPFDTLLGHELGHGLTMFHGDGQDNDGDLVELIGDGVGDDDGICEVTELCNGLDEPGEVAFPFNIAGPDLMQYRTGSLLTNNQRDRIRNQALLHIPDIVVDPVVPPLADARADDLGEVPVGEEFIDIEAFGIAVDQQDDTTVFTISTGGPLPANISGLRYFFSVDTDNDASTGGDPISIPGVPSSSAQGIELVGIVDVLVAGGIASASATVFKFDPPTNDFVQVIDPSIQAQVITNRVAAILEEDEPDSDPAGISESIQLEMSNSVRGSVGTILNMEVLSENANTGTMDEGAGPLTTQIAAFPSCTVNPPSSVQLGTVTVDAINLPPNDTVEVFLGADLLATGPTDASGNASISVATPADAPTGFQQITVVAQGTAITADCALFIGAAPEFDIPPTPPLGSTLTVFIGDTLSFDVQASDADVADVVSLDVIGTPLALGATFTAAPGNPASGTFSWIPTPGQEGDHLLVFTAQDQHGQSAPPHSLTIQVIANRPPVADAGPDQTVECTSVGAALVTLDGSASSDPDGDPLTFSWTGPFPEGGGTVTGVTPTVTLPLDSSVITLIVNDGQVDSAPDTMTVTVEDTTPPTLSIGISPETLWPPNHRLVPVTATVVVTDICDPAPAFVLESITSNEPDNANGVGDGNTVNDIQGAERGTPDLEFLLRAERAGSGDGRVYTITYRATDASGNVALATPGAPVPHDQGGVVEPLVVALHENEAGTVLEWSAAPGAQYYNVIRGSLESLQEHDSLIDIGTVSCIQGNVYPTFTEDGELPSPSEALFYLIEYVDIHGQATSYGTESAAKPRIPSSGACQ